VDNLDPQGQSDQQGGGTATQPWYSTLGPDYANNPSVTKFKEVGDLVRSYTELERMMGREKLVAPKDESDKAAFDAIFNRLGRPAEPKAYDTPNLEMPEPLQMRPEVLDAFKAKAHELGLTKKQFAEVFAFYNEGILNGHNQSLEAQNQAKAQSETVLRKELGAAYEARVDMAKKIVQQYFNDPEAMKVLDGPLGNNPAFIRGLIKLGESMGTDKIAGKPTMTTLTPVEAQKEINAIMADTTHPLNKAYQNHLDPNHKFAVDRVISLTEMLGGEV